MTPERKLQLLDWAELCIYFSPDGTVAVEGKNNIVEMLDEIEFQTKRAEYYLELLRNVNNAVLDMGHALAIRFPDKTILER